MSQKAQHQASPSGSAPVRPHRREAFERVCPAGHRLKEFDGVRCPVCGRLVPGRYARVCPNGHLVGGPARYCPICGEPMSDGPRYRAVLTAALGIFLIFSLIAIVSDLPQRVTESVFSMWAWIESLLQDLLPFGS